MHTTKTRRRSSVDDKRLAVPTAVALALFLNPNLVLVLPWALAADEGVVRAWSLGAGVVIQYGGAIVVALCVLTLGRRLTAHKLSTEHAGADQPAATGRRTSPVLVTVIAGLILMAASELPAVLYQVNGSVYAATSFEVALETVVVALGVYLGPVLVAVGTYLALRRLEEATTSPPADTAPVTQPVTDLDE